MLKFIESKRLIIRPFKDSDAPFLVNLLNEPDFILHIGDKQVKTIEDAIDYLKKGPQLSYQQHGFGLSAVCLKETNTPIGMCGLLKREVNPQVFNEIEVGYALLSQYYAQGYAIEAVKALLDRAHQIKNFAKIAAITSSNNIKSQSLLYKCGFQFEKNIAIFEDEDPVKLFLKIMD